MRDYARRQASTLLERLALEIDRSAATAGEDEIHDLRVTLRRLSRCLRAFAQFYPDRWGKKARAQISALLHTAGAVRDRDIALQLLAEAGISRRAAIVARLQLERAKASRELTLEVRRWRDRGFAAKWQVRIGR